MDGDWTNNTVPAFFSYLCTKNNNAMKVKLTQEQIKKLAENPESKVDISDPWWVIVLKVTAYLIGLILAGMGTTTTAAAIGFCSLSLPI